MEIQQKLLTKSYWSRTGEKQGKIEHIIVHYVANPMSSAMQNRNYFQNLRLTHKTRASSHYVIGLNGEIVQCIPDAEVSLSTSNATFNRNSISIENCHPDKTGKFNDKTYNSLIELCVFLCKKYGIKPENIVRHYDVTRKICPIYFIEHQAEWQGFKNQVAQRLNEKIQPKKEESFNMAKTYKNGSTSEPVYAETTFKTKTGSLDKYEQCECLDVVNGAYLVKYKVNNSSAYKTGFVKYSGGVK